MVDRALRRSMPRIMSAEPRLVCHRPRRGGQAVERPIHLKAQRVAPAITSVDFNAIAKGSRLRRGYGVAGEELRGQALCQRVAPAITSFGFSGMGNGSSGIGSSWSRNVRQRVKKSARVVARRTPCRNPPVGSTPRPMKFIYFFMLLIWADSRTPGVLTAW